MQRPREPPPTTQAMLIVDHAKTAHETDGSIAYPRAKHSAGDLTHGLGYPSETTGRACLPNRELPTTVVSESSQVCAKSIS
jgi:hypothetical protein